MELGMILGDEPFTMVELMAPTELDLMQDFKANFPAVIDAPPPESSGQETSFFSQSQSNNYIYAYSPTSIRSLSPNNHATHSLPSERSNTSASEDDILFQERPKEPYNSSFEFIDASFSAGSHGLYQQETYETSYYAQDGKDTINVQVNDACFADKMEMIPSVVNVESDVSFPDFKEEPHQAFSKVQQSPGFAETSMGRGKNLAINTTPSRSSKVSGVSKSRKTKGPKPKLHQRTEPYSDAEMETKRRNAIKAHKNRQKAKDEKEKLEAEIRDLKKQLQKVNGEKVASEAENIELKKSLDERDRLIQQLDRQRLAVTENRIKVLKEELALLTGQYVGSL
ncbi:uncharacterized protein LOC125178384 [Hyalella azteca]|uniref:Uncharacterized protein LOC125178384 n=1 Tax=Hyalella azteca TaxID=294128 RepID=A0A979FMN4_HYAAZ|nr:uncharacterized protein LOC125178384 [Hyalella azteca]